MAARRRQAVDSGSLIGEDDTLDSKPDDWGPRWWRQLRNNCSVGSRRREMCCCVSFWLVAFACVGSLCWLAALLITGSSRTGAVVAQPQTNDEPDVFERCLAAGNSRCSVPHTAAVHRRQEQCPPGHALNNAESVRLWTRNGQPSRGICMRRYFYPRVYDASLGDSAVPVCSDVYQHVCGAWDEWFDDNDEQGSHQYIPDAARLYHANVQPVLEASLSDADSVLRWFVQTRCRPLKSTAAPAVRDTPDGWLAAQANGQLPIWLSDSRAHTLCLLRAANQLVAPWFYELTVGLPSAKASLLKTRVTRALDSFAAECANTTAWLGALGDPLIAQIDARSDNLSHAEIHARLGAEYGHVWTAAVAFAPYSWLMVAGRSQLALRIALPLDSAEFAQRAHCERIASVMFVELLEDRYTALVRRTRPEAVTAALTQCVALSPRVTMLLDERPETVRSRIWHCIQDARQATTDWHTFARAVSLCQIDHRLHGPAPMQDAFVPSVIASRSGADQVVLRATPALFQAPWFSDEMDLRSVAARLYWRLLRAVADAVLTDAPDDRCSYEAAADRWTLQAMQQCFSPLLDARFWLELVQTHCGATCPQRWRETVQQLELFRRAHKCGK